MLTHFTITTKKMLYSCAGEIESYQTIYSQNINVNRCQTHLFTPIFFEQSLKVCGANMFRCVDNSCIPNIHLCNGIKDCPCSEDEMLCNGSIKETSTLFPHTYYHKILTIFYKDYSIFHSNITHNLTHCGNGDQEHIIPENKWCV